MAVTNTRPLAQGHAYTFGQTMKFEYYILSGVAHRHGHAPYEKPSMTTCHQHKIKIMRPVLC
eukprot:12431474-Karenia_brevis.AAC.2